MKTESQIKDFTRLVQKHQGIIFKVSKMYCDDEDCRKDLFQDILLQLWRSFPGYEKRASFSTWMYRVALNTAITQFRHSKRENIDFVADMPAVISAEEYDYEKEESFKILHRAIGQLSKAEKSVIILYLDDYQYSEIADILGISVSNVGVKINRIKTRLQQILKDMGYGY